MLLCLYKGRMSMSHKLRRKLLLLVFLLVYFALAYTLLNYANITCVFQALSGIPCPGCGMTRAAKSLMRLDFASAWGYNPLIFAMPYVFLYLFCDWKAKIHKCLLLMIGILALINWVIHILRM